MKNKKLLISVIMTIVLCATACNQTPSLDSLGPNLSETTSFDSSEPSSSGTTLSESSESSSSETTSFNSSESSSSGITSSESSEPDSSEPYEPPSGERISSNWENIPKNYNKNFKYFGFYHPDGFVNEPSMLEEIDSLEMCNFYLLGVGTPTVLREKLAFVKSKGAKCSVGVPSGIYYLDYSQKYGMGYVHLLRNNWQALLNDFTSSISDYINDGTIYAFYIDEPAWNGIREAEFSTVFNYLAGRFPNTGRMACFATPEVGIHQSDKLAELPSSYFDCLTDVSYDCYADWNDEARLGYLNKLKSKLTKNQWIWATPRTFEKNPSRISTIINSLKGFYTEAIQDKQYRGMSCFSWSNGFDGDWDYGAKAFVLEDSEHYSREVHALMSDVARSIIRKPLIDWSQIPVLSLVPPREVYTLGEKIPFPKCGAVDGKGNDLEIQLSVKSPSGNAVDISNGYILAEEMGHYQFTVSVEQKEHHRTKTCAVSVRYDKEISIFDNSSYVADAGGDSSSLWCWPRQVVTNFAHTGTGCLKVTPHPNDGTWPTIKFNHDGHDLWDLSQVQKVSLWIYNPSDEPIRDFGLIFTNEYLEKEANVYALKDIPSRQWTNIVGEVTSIATNPKINITKTAILFGNCASDYKNRTVFYLDDVMMINDGETPTSPYTHGFDTPADVISLPTPTDADAWCWPRAFSMEKVHDGLGSLKVTPHPTDGTWAVVDFGRYNLSQAEKVELWLYADGEADLNHIGLMFAKESTPDYTYYTVLTAKTWVKYEVSVSTIQEKISDLTNVRIFIGNVAGTYTNRCPIFMDSFNIVAKEGPETPPVINCTHPFDTAEDVASLPTPTADDAWCWPRAFSTERSHDGPGSLKVTPHPTDGTWATVNFGKYNLIGVSKVRLWIYADSDTNLDLMGLMFAKGDNMPAAYTYYTSIAPRQWVLYEVETSTLANYIDDLSSVKIYIGNVGGTYPNRCPIFLDSFDLVS
ncbi:MAG: hypothetical protein ACOX3K_02395 [Bacilli bacterium]|jgi:hypothetical protein